MHAVCILYILYHIGLYHNYDRKFSVNHTSCTLTNQLAAILSSHLYNYIWLASSIGVSSWRFRPYNYVKQYMYVSQCPYKIRLPWKGLQNLL